MHCLRCGAELADNELACAKCGYLEEITRDVKQKKVKLRRVKAVPDRPYAGFVRRSAALILDFLILIGGEVLLAALIGGLILLMAAVGNHDIDFDIIRSFAVGFGVVFSFAINWIYFTWFESSKYQATLGKKIMGLIVADQDGKRIYFGQANFRYWGKILSTLILFGGFWMMAFFKNKRTLHDLLAGTMVLKQKSSAPKKEATIELAPEPN
jgi:uncharacterized RDD family membrane protein YckC/ribosomal protein L40E